MKLAPLLIHAKAACRPPLLAFGLLTRLPIPDLGDGDMSRDLGRSLHWYPLVGLVIGVALAVVAALPLPSLLQAALALALWVGLTGALHLDGLADCADAWVGGMGDRERTLRILKDPACGPMGATALVLVLLLKVAALYTLFDGGAVLALLLTPVSVRAVLPAAFIVTPYVRPGGMGDTLARHYSPGGTAISTLLVLAATLIALPLALWIAWLASILVLLWLWRRAMIRRLGGFTGDGAGALVELGETLLLLVTATLAGAAL